jgi:outer membrane protein TolC
MWRRRAALGALVASLMTTPAARAGEHELTLDEAILRALDKNTSIRVEREGLVTAKAAQKGARSIYEPFVTIDTGWRKTKEPINSTFSGAPAGDTGPRFKSFDTLVTIEQNLPSGGTATVRASGVRATSNNAFALLSPSYATRFGIELRQPLWPSVEATRSGIRVAAADRDRAEASLEREIADTVTAVERAYWVLNAARREVGVREAAVKLADEQLGQTRIRLEQGVAAEAEVAQPRAELERRRGEELAAREAVARAESALKVLILDDGDAELWTAPLVPKDDAEVKAEDVDTAGWMEKALASRAEIRAAQAFVERRKVEAALARDRTRPTLDAIVSYDIYGLAGVKNPAVAGFGGTPVVLAPDVEGGWGRSIGNLTDRDSSNTRIGILFEMPIGNRKAKAAAAAAESAQRQAEAQLSAARQAVRAEVLEAAATLDTAGQRIAAARAAREAAEVQLSAERDRFEAGLSTNFLVLTRQNDLSRARLDEIASVHDYLTARTTVARATGSLLAERKIEIEGAQ